MDLTFVRHPGRRSTLLLLIAVVGAGVAALAYLTTPLVSAPVPVPDSPVSRGLAPDGRIRVPMFVDPALVKPTPRFRFSFDPPAALEALRVEENLDAVVAGAADDLDAALRLMHWVRRQWEPGIPSPYPPIDARIILRDIRSGFTGGFCAQYNYVLAQGLQSLGLPARYVTLIEHEVIEVYLPSRDRWVCLDPLYDTTYTDGAGNPLSVHEIQSRGRSGLPVRITDPRLTENAYPGDPQAHMAAFASFSVWVKNDHVSSPINFTDLERYKVHFLPDGPGSTHLPPGALETSEPADLYPGQAPSPTELTCRKDTPKLEASHELRKSGQ